MNEVLYCTITAVQVRYCKSDGRAKLERRSKAIRARDQPPPYDLKLADSSGAPPSSCLKEQWHIHNALDVTLWRDTVDEMVTHDLGSNRGKRNLRRNPSA